MAPPPGLHGVSATLSDRSEHRANDPPCSALDTSSEGLGRGLPTVPLTTGTSSLFKFPKFGPPWRLDSEPPRGSTERSIIGYHAPWRALGGPPEELHDHAVFPRLGLGRIWNQFCTLEFPGAGSPTFFGVPRNLPKTVVMCPGGELGLLIDCLWSMSDPNALSTHLTCKCLVSKEYYQFTVADMWAMLS